MKCWYSELNAQGWGQIIVVVQLGAVKIWHAVEALRKKERQDETQFITQIDGFLSFISRWMLTYFFAGFFLNFTLCMTKLRVLVLCFSYFTDNSNITGYLNFFYNCGQYLRTWSISQNRAFEFFDNCNYRLEYPDWYPEGVCCSF
jgi:hypothetical protein